MGLIPSGEGVNRTERLTFSKQEGIQSIDGLQTRAAASALPQVSSPPVHCADFALTNLYNDVSQFLKITLSPDTRPEFVLFLGKP